LIDAGLPHARPPAFDPSVSFTTRGRTRIERDSSKEEDSGPALVKSRGLISRIAYVTGKCLAAFVNHLRRLFSEPEPDWGIGTRLLREVILRDREDAFHRVPSPGPEEATVLFGARLSRDENDSAAFTETRPVSETCVTDPSSGAGRAPDPPATAEGKPGEMESWFLLISGVPDTSAGISFRVEEGSGVVGEALAASLHTLENLAIPDGPGAEGRAGGVDTLPGAERLTEKQSRRTSFPWAWDKIEWLSTTPCRILYPAVPAGSEEDGNRRRPDRREFGPLAFIASLGDAGRATRKGDPAEHEESRSGGDLGGRLAAVLGGGEYDRIIGHAIATLIERGARTTFHRLATLCESPGTRREEPREPDDCLEGKRKHTNTYRKMWERRHGKEWPDDPTRPGRKMVVHHKDPLGDGGPDVPENVQPMTYDGHIHHHREDFRRWGARSRLNRKGGRELHGGGLDKQS
jgi:hypothetical protein